MLIQETHGSGSQIVDSADATLVLNAVIDFVEINVFVIVRPERTHQKPDAVMVLFHLPVFTGIDDIAFPLLHDEARILKLSISTQNGNVTDLISSAELIDGRNPVARFQCPALNLRTKLIYDLLI